MKLETFDPHLASEDVLKGVHEVISVIEAENLPDDPPMTYETRRVRFLAPLPAHNQLFRWLGTEDDQIVASSWALRWPEEDPDNSLISVMVLPEHRRRGIGKSMLKEALGTVADAGSRRVIIDCVAGRPWEPALGRLGMECVLNDKQSRLYLAEVDWDLMDEWISRAEERASDYELITFTSPIPDEYMERFCAVSNVMNTAPLEGLEINDRVMTPEKMRSIEEMMAGRGDTALICVAVHRPTGEFAGFTDVVVNANRPEKVGQNDTAVDPAHRNKGLGRWLKATMVKWIAADYPKARWIDTNNVESNAPMLGINVAMGFKPVLLTNAWQGDIDTVRAGLT